MAMENVYWSYPCETESGRRIIVTGRDNIDKYKESGKYIYRINVYWDYNSLPDGMPEAADADLMERATDAFENELAKDKAAVLTGIYTGDGRRDWVFYTTSLFIFQKIFNRALEPLETIPLVVEAQEDPEWQEYADMRAQTYIPPEE